MGTGMRCMYVGMRVGVSMGTRCVCDDGCGWGREATVLDGKRLN